MKTLFFGKLDPKRRKLRVPFTPRTADEPAYDTAHGTALLTPEWDKGNDDPNAIRSSLGLDDKRHPPSE